MGRRTQKYHHSSTKSHTLPSSPTHSSSSSSSDFEFTISVSPRKSSAALCPADELFYKGQLLPLHLSPRLSMVRTLLLSSSSTSSSSDTTTTASRDSTASHSSADSSANVLQRLECDSSRPSSVTDDESKRLANTTSHNVSTDVLSLNYHQRKPSKFFSLAKFSTVFRKESKTANPPSSGGTAVKRASSSAKEVIRKYLKKVKPLYEKLSQKQQQQQKISCPPTSSSRVSRSANTTLCLTKDKDQEFLTRTAHPKVNPSTNISLSFSGNLRYPRRRRSCISSCPSSMMSSPSHGKSVYGYGYGFGLTQTGHPGSGAYNLDVSSMEELQNAIQGAIAHCKNSLLKNKNLDSTEI